MKTITELKLREMAKLYIPGNGSNIRQVIDCLMEARETTPMEIARKLKKSSTTVSIVLKHLRRRGLVEHRVQGRNWHYRIKNRDKFDYWKQALMALVEDWENDAGPFGKLRDLPELTATNSVTYKSPDGGGDGDKDRRLKEDKDYSYY